jgi:hypothetical protein
MKQLFIRTSIISKINPLFLLAFILLCLCACQHSVSHSDGALSSIGNVNFKSEENATIAENDNDQYTEQEVESDCPLEGNAQSNSIQELNILKNRSNTPSAEDFDNSITLSKLVALGSDESRWSTNKAARIKGYVYDVKPGGVETCNCKNKDINQRDTHIEIVMDPNNSSKAQRMIVEVTPRIRKAMKLKGIDWSTRALRDKYLGRFVEVEGWMLFDKEHKNAAENTNPTRPNNWRATAWEIHPITKITVLTKNPNY